MRTDKTKSMTEALKTHYSEQALGDQQLDELMSMQRESLSEVPSGDQKIEEAKTGFLPHTWRDFFDSVFLTPKWAFSGIAGVMLVCGLLWSGLTLREPLSVRIMDEIAYNHQQDMPTEIRSASLEDIGQYLNRLSFSMATPSRFRQSDWQFMGGRYCSINGKLAAQLKVKHLTDNTIHTLYQASIESPLNDVKAEPVTMMVEGVEVSIWYESGLLMGLASNH